MVVDRFDCFALNPELRAIKERYASEFQRAFAAAFSELTANDRHLLRMSVSAKLARMYGTHRSTAARWLGTARARLARRTREHLRRMLSLESHELDSLLQLIRSAVARWLETIPPEP